MRRDNEGETEGGEKVRKNKEKVKHEGKKERKVGRIKEG